MLTRKDENLAGLYMSTENVVLYTTVGKVEFTGAVPLVSDVATSVVYIFLVPVML